MFRQILLRLFFSLAVVFLLGNFKGIQAQQFPHLSTLSKDVQSKIFKRGVPTPSWVNSNTWGLESKQDSREIPLLVHVDDSQFYVDKEPVVYYHKMLQANESAMLNSVGQIEIALQPEYQVLSLHTLRIIRGKTILDVMPNVDIRFLQRETEMDSGVLTGLITASIVVNDVREGDVLDIAYSVQGQNPVFEGKIANSFLWDSTFPTQKKRVLLNFPLERAIQYRVIGQGEGKILTKENVVGTRKLISLTGENLAPIEFEEYVPGDVDQFRRIQVSEFRDWHQLAQWASGLFHDKSNAIKVEQLTAGMLKPGANDEMVESALQYVQSRIRYLSLSIGENSHKPFAPDLVLERGYGDCKDKANLLAVMLRNLGIDADPVLVSTYTKKNLERMLPSPLIFDHAIVRVRYDNRELFLDPTRGIQTSATEQLGQVHFGSEVLVASPSTERLQKIPALVVPNQPTNRIVERAVLPTIDGDATFALEHEYIGLEAEYMRALFAQQTKDQLIKMYKNLVQSHYPYAELLGSPIVFDLKRENIFRVKINYLVKKFLEKKNLTWTASYFPSNLKSRFYVPRNSQRKYPLAVPQVPSNMSYSFELKLPKDFQGRSAPAVQYLQNDVFVVEEKSSFENDLYRVELQMKILKDRVPAADVVNLVKDLRKLDAVLEGNMQFNAEDLKGTSIVKLLDAPLNARQVQSQKQSVIETSKVLGGEHASDSSNTKQKVQALCERAIANAKMRKKAEVGNDLALLKSLSNNDLNAKRCEAQILFFNLDMKESATSFASLLAMGDVNFLNLYLSALSQFSLGKWRESADTFSRAFTVATNEDEKVKAEVMRVISLRRIAPYPFPTTTYAAAEEWPSIIIPALVGAKTEDHVLRQVHRRIGDELELALSDTYFYFSQLHAINGNKMKAGIYLQRAYDKGILSSYLRPVLAYELERSRR